MTLPKQAQEKCHHKFLSEKLGYVAWHEMASKRKDKQKQCPVCKLWLFEEEW